MHQYLIYITCHNPHRHEELWADTLSEALDLIIAATRDDDLENVQLFKVTYQGEFTYTNPRVPPP